MNRKKLKIKLSEFFQKESIYHYEDDYTGYEIQECDDLSGRVLSFLNKKKVLNLSKKINRGQFKNERSKSTSKPR